ncbi:MAG: helix-turn-helix transcriptional regulator [Bdellovibrionales bacterium]|nr:helix-turn-helix transcriptional regulator [Bdellovibrionales bacterium]
MKKENKIGPKLSAIAKSKGLTQQFLADQCQISRLTIQRFFKGHTELKCGDLTQLLTLLGFSLEDQIDRSFASSGQINFEQEWNEITTTLQKLSPRVQKVLIEQINWWKKQEGVEPRFLPHQNRYVEAQRETHGDSIYFSNNIKVATV